MLKTFDHFLRYSPALLSSMLVLLGSAGAIAATPEASTSTPDLADFTPGSTQVSQPNSQAMRESVAAPTYAQLPQDQSATPANANPVSPTGLSQPTPNRANPMMRIVPVSGLENSNAAPTLTKQPSGSQPARSMGQVTSVSQLSDVQPTDWAFQALQSLVERYGCIVGYPDSTFRGNRALSRYEFAAGLNACMTRIEELIAATTAPLATKEDLAIVQKLQEEFAAELTAIRGWVDTLEARTAKLEAQQFSTTTKLSGEAIFSLVQQGGDTPRREGLVGVLDRIFNPSDDVPDQFTFNSRATLSLLTSFTGKDLLITSIQGGNFTRLRGAVGNAIPFALNLGPTVTSANTDNDVSLFYLQYRRPVLKDKGTVIVTGAGGELSDFTDSLNPYFESEGQGAISAFGLRNPIYRQINSLGNVNFAGVGAGFRYQFTPKIDLGVGYLAPAANATNPATNVGSDGGGLFGGDYAAIAQLTFRPLQRLGLGLTYIRSYSKAPGGNLGFGGFTGTTNANAPFNLVDRPGVRDDALVSTPASADSLGFQFSWRVIPRFTLGGWTGVSFARAEGGFFDGEKATILNYALTAAFPDLFIKGNLGGLIVGSQPQVISNSAPEIFGLEDKDTNIHIEAFYKFQINNFISITPGGFVVLNPEGSSNNDPVYVGTLRTTFSF